MKGFKNFLKSLFCDPDAKNKVSSLRLLLWMSVMLYFCFLGKKLFVDDKTEIPKTLDNLVVTLTGGVVLSKFQKKNKDEKIIINGSEIKNIPALETPKELDKRVLLKEEDKK